MKNIVQELKKKIIFDSYRINAEEALLLYSTEYAKELFDAANEIRMKTCPLETSVCSIINAKQQILSQY